MSARPSVRLSVAAVLISIGRRYLIVEERTYGQQCQSPYYDDVTGLSVWLHATVDRDRICLPLTNSEDVED